MLDTAIQTKNDYETTKYVFYDNESGNVWRRSARRATIPC